MEVNIIRDGNREKLCVMGAPIKRAPFSDFSGANSNGNHHFNIVIPEEHLEKFRHFGYSPYYLDGKDGKYTPEWILDNVIGYKFGDPGVFLVPYGCEKRELKEKDLIDLDDPYISIDYVDMFLSPHPWTNNGKSGVKPYVSQLHVYLSAPSYIEQRYQERLKNAVQTEPVQETFIPVEDEDIPF